MARLKIILLLIINIACQITVELQAYDTTGRYACSKLKDKKNIIPIAIFGSGPGGLTAGLYSSRAGFYSVIFQGPKPGGQLMDAGVIENWPGLPPVKGIQAIKKLEAQALHFGAHIVPETIERVNFNSWPFEIITSDNTTLNALSVIIATGATPKKIGVKGEDFYWGKGVLSCTVCDAPLSKNKDIVIYVEDDISLERILQVIPYAKSITVITPESGAGKNKKIFQNLKLYPKIKVIYNHKINEIIGDGKKLTEIALTDINTNESRKIKTSVLYVSVGFKPTSDLFTKSLKMGKNNTIAVACNSQKTSINGIFAAGNVTDSKFHQAASASGEGCKAALEAISFLSQLECNGITDKKINKSAFYKPIKKLTAQVPEIQRDTDFERHILNPENNLTLVEFYSPTCSHCIQMKPIVNTVASKFKNFIPTYKININKLKSITDKYQITGLPTFILFKKGNEINRVGGEMAQKELIKFIRDTIKNQYKSRD